MKFRSTLPVLAAAALTAVSATSALAVEHQFGGSFTVIGDVSNFNNADIGVKAPQTLPKDAETGNFVTSRARIGYTAKANNDLKFVSMFELDYSFWGNSAYGYDHAGNKVNRNGGGALGADTVNIETKNLYLDANVAKNTNLKLGMQGFSDSFKGTFVDADMAGALLTHSYSNATATMGLFRWDDKSTGAATLGRETRDVLVLDGKYDLNKHTKLGAAYYFVKDNTKMAGANNSIHMLGVNAEAVAGALTLDGFIAAQFGEVGADQRDLSAYAASIGAKTKLGKGTLRGDLLYTSGDDEAAGKSKSHAWQSVTGIGGSESGYYANEMAILGRDKYDLTVDNAIVYDANNRNRGVIFAALGYDQPLSEKLSASANLGFAWNETNAVADKTSNKFLGTEVNAELVYKATDSISIAGRAAYVFLGDYCKDVNGFTPENPYDVKIVAKYSF